MRSTSVLLQVVLVCAVLGLGEAGRCKLPPPSLNFTRQGYSGDWYEIAKFQTKGGAFFEKDCVCTNLNVF